MKMYCLVVVVGYVKVFMKFLDSVCVEKVYGGGVKFVIVVLCVNVGI